MPDLRTIGPFPSVQIVSPPPLESELVAVPVSVPAPGSRRLTYHGGPTIRQPRIVLVQFGQFWDDVAKLDRHAKMLIEDGYLSALGPYGSGVGTFLGSVQAPALSGQLLDSQVQQVLERLIAGHTLPAPDANSLYLLIMSVGLTVQFDGGTQRSCHEFCSYHSMYRRADGTPVYYGVQSSTRCNACNQGDAYTAFTMVLAHEIAEACSDPEGSGWYEDTHPDGTPSGEENADITAWTELAYGPEDDPIAVQGYWTNETGNAFGRYVAPALPQPDLTPLYEWLARVAGYEVETHDRAELRVIVQTILAFAPEAGVA